MMESRAFVIECEQPPTPWQDPVLTSNAVSRMIANGNTHLWAYLDKHQESYGHIVALSDGFDWEILTLWVQPKCRGKRIGKALVGTLLENARAQGMEKIFLEVRRSNTLAIKLYKSFGFQQISTRLNYYTAPVEDALMFELDLVKEAEEKAEKKAP